MNELPERDDAMIRRLLKESGIDESPELLDGLRKLRSFTGAAAPAPTGELAELLSESARDRSKQPRRHRGLILSFTLAAAMAAGASGVAASTITGLRLTTESVTPAEVRDASPVEEDSGQETDADSDPGPAAPASPSTAEAVSPEAAFPEATPAAPEPQTETDTAPDHADTNLPAPPAPPADPSGPVPQTFHPEEADCEHGDGAPGDPGRHGKPEHLGNPGGDRGAGDINRSRAGESGRGGEPGRDTGGGSRHGGGENAGNHPRQDFSEGNRAPGNS